MIIDEETLNSIVENIKKERKSIVFTNGVFDILHRGHVEYLIRSKEHGDVLIVGINSDKSVKRLKGENRPINSQEDRAMIIDSLKAVDHTIIFDQDTPYELIKSIMPDILIKGGDYDPSIIDPDDKKYIVGSDIIKNNGGKVLIINLVPDRSTTLTIKKIMEE